MCSKFYSLVLSCTAHAAPQPHKRAKRRVFWLFRIRVLRVASAPHRADLGGHCEWIIHWFKISSGVARVNQVLICSRNKGCFLWVNQNWFTFASCSLNSESDLIHYNKNDKTFCAGGPRASKQMLLANKIFSIKSCCIAVLGLPHGVHIETSLLKFTSYLLYW